MPDINSGIALGELAGGIGRALAAKKQREYAEQQKQHDLITSMVSAGLQSGTIKDPNAAFQFLMGGGSGKGKKGKDLPPMLQSLIGATGKLVGKGGGTPDPSKTMGGQDQPTMQGPAQPSPVQFTTQSERADADEAAKLQGEKNRFAQVTTPEIELRGKQRLKEIEEQNKTKGGELRQRINAEIDAFATANGREPSPEELPALMDKARGAFQSAGRKESDYKTFEQTWLTDAGAGKDLTPQQKKVEMLKARKAWALAGQSENPDQKLSRAMALKKYENELVQVTPDDVKELSQAVTVGDQTARYFDLGSVTGAKEKLSASRSAIANGIIPVSAKQAEGLVATDAANKNILAFFDQIKSKLPADAASRPLTSIENKLSQYFQTDEALASASGWDITVIPMLRAIAATGLGRITNKEIVIAENSRPKITDTVGTAARNVQNVQQMLRNNIDPILHRGEKAASPSGRGQTATPVTPEVSGLLKGKKAGHYKLNDGSEWDVASDGSIKASKKAA